MSEEPRARFKPGDKVLYKGTVTSIDGVRGPPWTYTLGREVGRVSGIPENELELARAAPARLPEKPRFVTVQDVVNYSVDAALTHISEDYIRVNARGIFQSQGRGPARKFLKEQIRNWGSSGPGLPFVKGTPTGVEIEYADEIYTTTWSEILSRALDPNYRPSYKHVGKAPPPIMVPERVEFKPPLKDLIAGRVLDGYIEAARVKPLTEFLSEDEAKVVEQIVENCKFWNSNICKRETLEKYLVEKGIENPGRILEDLIRKGLAYTAKRGYIGLTEPEKYGLPPIEKDPEAKRIELIAKADNLLEKIREAREK